MLLNLSLLGLVSLAAAKTIHITVGDNGQLKYSPDSVTADVGDQVTFEIYPGHTVTQGDGFSNPCVPKPGGIFSGPIKTSKADFTINIVDTNPIWLYCSFPGHCQLGMVGVINPGSNSIDAYAAAAKNAPASSDQGTENPGPGPASSSSSSSSSAASKSSASSASSSAASGTKSSSAAAASSTTGAAATSSAGNNATASRPASPPPAQQTTNAASSTYTSETVMVNAFLGLIALAAGWAGLL